MKDATETIKLSSQKPFENWAGKLKEILPNQIE